MKNDSILNAYLNIISESVSGRQILDDADFEKEMNDAISSKELVTFKYKKKDGSQYTMTILPYKMFEVAGKKAVKAYLNGVQDKSNERMLYIDSMGNAQPAPEDKAEEVVPDENGKIEENGAMLITKDFQKQVEQAADEKKMISFWYRTRYSEKRGRSDIYKYKCEKYTVLPIEYKIDYDDYHMWWLDAYVDGVQDEAHKRTFSYNDFCTPSQANDINEDNKTNQTNENVSFEMTEEMKELSSGLTELLDSNSDFKVGPTPYFAILKKTERESICKEFNESYLFFKPVGYSPESNKVVIECHVSDDDESSYKDGDYDDGRGHSWTTNTINHTPSDEVVGYIWGELKDDKIFTYTGIALTKLTGNGTSRTWTSNERWTRPYRLGGRRRW